MDITKAKAHIPKPEIFTYKQRDAIIYALGIGAKAKEDNKFVYEGNDDFTVFPTFVVAPAFPAMNLMDWPGVEFDLTRILHGEQYIEIFEDLPDEGTLRSEARLVDILDKGSGALFLSNITTYDNDTGKKLSVQQFGTFQVGSGKFGGPRSSEHEYAPAQVPKSDPDAVVEQLTTVDQAALYRQGSGDLNPLHVDANFAKMSGFKEPILHGLCSLGFAARHVVSTWANNDARQFVAMKVRFSSPVIPGQTLRTEMWKDGSRVIFQTKVKETGKVVIANGWIKLKNVTGPNVPSHLAAKL